MTIFKNEKKVKENALAQAKKLEKKKIVSIEELKEEDREFNKEAVELKKMLKKKLRQK